MPASDWYYACDGQQAGPVSSGELKQAAETGKLKPEDLVWQEGMKEWIPARKVKGLFETRPAAAPAPAASPALAPPPVLRAERPQAAFEPSMAAYQRSREGGQRHPLDALLVLFRKQFALGFAAGTARLFSLLGYYGLYALIVLVLAQGVLEGVLRKSGNPLLQALAGAALVAVWQYAAGRFLTTVDRLTQADPARLSSTVFLDFWALLHLLAGLMLLVACSILAVQRESLPLALAGLAAFILGQYTAVLAVNPEFLRLSIAAEAGVVEEALGTLAFFAKATLRLAPVAFGSAVVWLVVTGICATAGLICQVADVPSAAKRLEALLWTGGFTAQWWVNLILLLWPLWAYLGYLLYHLLVELLRALLGLPEKIDQLTGDKPKPEE